MALLNDRNFLIPYGAAAWSEDRLDVHAPGPEGAAYECRAPHVVAVRGRPLRLNSPGYEFHEPPRLRDLLDTAAQVEFLLGHLELFCDLWGKYQKLFVARYFDFVQGHAAANRAELEELLKPFGELYDPDHWVFSALRPLPQAQVYAPGNPGGPSGSGGSYAAAGMVAADFAFWDGTGVIAVDLVGADGGPARDKRRARLEGAGVSVVEIPRRDLERATPETAGALFPDRFRRFWKGEPFPSGPLKFPGLDGFAAGAAF